MKFVLNNKEIELTEEEIATIVKQQSEKKEEKVVGVKIMSRYGSLIFQSTKTTFKEAVIERLASDANLCGANLRGADLCGANLCGADLCGANLRDADLRGADLCGANLRGADLCGANLCGADLCDADLRGAELNCVKFYGRGGQVVIKKANLEGFLGALGFKLEE
jgi:uncharacterized protein YjbI with pentapeptide repeats